MAQSRPPEAVLCPFCGTAQFSKDLCTFCHKPFTERGRKQAQIEMGPWHIRNKANPYAAGLSYAMMKKLAVSGILNAKSVVRGPATQQFWLMAKFTPGISHLVGFCYACPAAATDSDTCCAACKAPFKEYPDRNSLGLRYKTEAEAQAARQELLATATSPRTGLHDDHAPKPNPLSAVAPPDHAPKPAPPPRQAVLQPEKPGEKPFIPGADLLGDLFGKS